MKTKLTKTKRSAHAFQPLLMALTFMLALQAHAQEPVTPQVLASTVSEEKTLAGSDLEQQSTEAALKQGTQVELKTSKGNITLLLNNELAPETVENFVHYLKDDFYDGLIFHRVIPNFMIQGGGFTPTMTQKPTRAPIKNEAHNGLKNLRGTIAMARLPDKDSATSQFFINLVDNAFLDHQERGYGYAVFGKVIQGMDVVDSIGNVATGRRGVYKDVPQENVIIHDVTIISPEPTP